MTTGGPTTRKDAAASIRLGVAVPTDECPEWIADWILSIRAEPSIDLVVVVASHANGNRSQRGSLVAPLFATTVAFASAVITHPAQLFAPVRLQTVLDTTSTTTQAKPDWHELPPIDEVPRHHRQASALEIYNLDVLVWLVDGRVPDDLCSVTRYGVWSIPSALRATSRDRGRLVQDLNPRATLARVVLYVQLTMGPPPRKVADSVVPTTSLSWHNTRATVVRRACALITRRLFALQRLGCGALTPSISGTDHLSSPVEKGPAQSKATIRPVLPRRIAARKTLTIAQRHVRRMIEGRHKWFVAVGRRADADSAVQLPERLRPILPPPGHEYADPFPFEWDGQLYLLVEDIPHSTGRGRISLIELNTSLSAGRVTTVLEQPFHLSYPYVFEADGDLYLIPESREAHRIDLYRVSDDGPGTWRHVTCLIDNIEAVDSTVFQHNGRFWLYCGVPAPDTASDWEELHLFTSRSLTEGWEPHPLNPVVSDPRRARPAGAPFVHNGSLIRPGQDCSDRYGESIVFSRIDVLSENDYVEVPAAVICPDWAPGLVATHTYNRSAQMTALDGNWRWNAESRSSAIRIEFPDSGTS